MSIFKTRDRGSPLDQGPIELGAVQTHNKWQPLLQAALQLRHKAESGNLGPLLNFAKVWRDGEVFASPFGNSIFLLAKQKKLQLFCSAVCSYEPSVSV